MIARVPAMDTKRLTRRPLSVEEILRWAVAHREASGKWPSQTSGSILGARFETWYSVDAALRHGLRGLCGGSSLAQLLGDRRGVRNIQNLPPLSEELILKWADQYQQRTGSWPMAKTGKIPDAGGDTWASIDFALRSGKRGLSGGLTLAQFLAQHRGKRNRKQLPRLTEELILQWADAHFARTGGWPTGDSGPIYDAPGETWTAVDIALHQGRRRIPGGSSLAFLLADKRGIENAWTLPKLSIEQILSWTDAFRERTGNWPTAEAGPILEAPGETWQTVNQALRHGNRGLPRNLSLAKLLDCERGVRNRARLPKLSHNTVLKWADAYQGREGKWPTMHSGPIQEAPGETWLSVDTALRNGSRGMKGDSSLARFLAKHRDKKNHLGQAPLSFKKILAWADAHFERTGKYPNVNSGQVVDAPSEKWDLIDHDLREGQRGLKGGSSLLRLLARKRGLRNPLNLPPLTEELILQWTRDHFERIGDWPRYNSGRVFAAPGETWAAVDYALRYGKRGLSGQLSVAKLLVKARVVEGKNQITQERNPSDTASATENRREAGIVASGVLTP